MGKVDAGSTQQQAGNSRPSAQGCQAVDARVLWKDTKKWMDQAMGNRHFLAALQIEESVLSDWYR